MSTEVSPILVGAGSKPVHLLPRMTNRHGLVAGATGTGKTVTLRVLAEQLSARGIPVFMADVKGDLSGLALAGSSDPRVEARVKQLGLTDFAYADAPVAFWDLAGKQGHPVRATVTDLGPSLLGRLLNLNDTQTGVLQLVFKLADDQGLLLLDLKDLRSMLAHVAEHASELKTTYGNVSPASIGAIQRNLLALEQEGAERFFGEPALSLEDFLQTDAKGRGVINVLAADELIRSPRLYATFLLWLLAELFEALPEVGDAEKPKLVFFFDEAHLLFDEAPKSLVDKIEQVVRLVRSKGVGIWFVTQNPLDLPETVLGQLGNRVQHALRAFTPKDQKAVRSAAETFRANPGLDVATVITELGVGEALVSTLDEKGTPTPVERVLIAPPTSRLTPLTPEERQRVLRGSVFFGHYENAVDRESAFELLKGRAAEASRQAALQAEQVAAAKAAAKPAKPSEVEKAVSGFAQSAVKAVGSSLGRELVRGFMGSLFGGGGSKRKR